LSVLLDFGSTVWPRTPPKAARETLSVLFVIQAARRAPEPGFRKFRFNGGAQGRTRNVERVVVSKWHGEPPNTVLRRTSSTGAFYEVLAQWGRFPLGIQAGALRGQSPRQSLCRGGSVGRRPERGGDFPLLILPIIIAGRLRKGVSCGRFS
jgi:hypothetical protein